MTTGWSIFYHPFRQNGKDGAHRPWDGNDGDPHHHRLANHFHTILVSRFTGPALIKRLNELKESCPILKGWSVIIGPNKKDKERARAEKRIFAPHEIADRHELEHKLAYILSHTAIRQTVDENGDPVGNRLPMVSHHGLNHYSRMSRICLERNAPLLSQGYEEKILEDDREIPVYWANLYYECARHDKDLYLAHVERVNSAHVYAFRFDKKGCKADIVRLVQEFRGDPSHAEHPERLLSRIYNFVSADPRFIFDFSPIEGAELRYPNPLFLPAGEKDLFNLIISDERPLDYDEDLGEVVSAALERDLSEDAPSLPDLPPKVAPIDEDWRDGIEDYSLRFGGMV